MTSCRPIRSPAPEAQHGRVASQADRHHQRQGEPIGIIEEALAPIASRTLPGAVMLPVGGGSICDSDHLPADHPGKEGETGAAGAVVEAGRGKPVFNDVGGRWGGH
ncbi:hypothetical protein MKK64_19115 [Methylobacterium sp. E-025]|uniref:hypothetical protein n=1 Tax=Methylobacterium sp. E-025 TaxID=2836561 RepID=UPI001FB96747|nr:hypothetical protein [Methylobacterium sp. E-025]MCJ2113290.1 hypothetical protein [Methylobacterium sp. E-025]